MLTTAPAATAMIACAATGVGTVNVEENHAQPITETTIPNTNPNMNVLII